MILPLAAFHHKYAVRGGLMVGAHGSRRSLGTNVVFIGKTLHSHSASLHSGVQMGTSKFNAGGNRGWTSIPSRGE